MGEVITIGVDIAKHVFQVHGVDEAGIVRIRRKLRQSEVLQFFEGLSPCLVGMDVKQHRSRPPTKCEPTS